MQSDDGGKSWRFVANFPFFHARPFVAGNSLYILGHYGKMMIIKDPTRVFVGIPKDGFGADKSGMTVHAMIDHYDARYENYHDRFFHELQVEEKLMLHRLKLLILFSKIFSW